MTKKKVKAKRLTKVERLERKRLERVSRHGEILAMDDGELNAGFFEMTGVGERTHVAFVKLEKSVRADAFLRMEEKGKE